MKLSHATPEIYSRIMEDRPGIIIPVGSMEWHDSHLPFGLDYLKLEKIADLIAQRAGCFVAPTMEYGYPRHISKHPEKSVGTFCPSFEPLRDFIFDIGKMYVKKGSKVLYFMSGHYERSQVFMLKLICRRLVDFARERGILIQAVTRMEPDFTIKEGISKMWKEDIAAEDCSPPHYKGDHAGFFETSLALHLVPELVKSKSIKTKYHHEELGKPSAKWGRTWTEMIVQKAAGEINDLFSSLSMDS